MKRWDGQRIEVSSVFAAAIGARSNAFAPATENVAHVFAIVKQR